MSPPNSSPRSEPDPLPQCAVEGCRYGGPHGCGLALIGVPPHTPLSRNCLAEQWAHQIMDELGW